MWGGRAVSAAQADRILNAVLDSGINFVDTSYNYGMSEEYIGRFLSHRRSEYILATKCGCYLSPAGQHDDVSHVWTRANLLHNIETSLRRMKTDYVDLWQLHNATLADVEQNDLVTVMQEVKASGKVRWRKNSKSDAASTKFIAAGAFDAYQIPYSALERAEEGSISAAAAAGAGTIIRGGVAKGAPDEAGQGAEGRWALWEKAGLDELRGSDESRTAFLLRLTLSHPGMHTTIVGTLDPEHLADNRRAADRGPLPGDAYREALRRLDAVGEKPAG